MVTQRHTLLSTSWSAEGVIALGRWARLDLREDTMNTDRKLQEDVLAELSWTPSLTAGQIGVTASDGIVTLTGSVGSFAEKHAAEQATSRVNGVKAVAEEIEVRLSFDMKRSDADIAAAAVNRLAWNVYVPKDAVKVQVEKGWVTLSGHVEWHYEKDAAEEDLIHLLGVVGVSNQITIKPLVNAMNISDDINHALNRSWFFDQKTFDVSASGGAVVLKGSVRSSHERAIAGHTAWRAPGVTSVENDLAII
jgi:osmotically-inducible protein OsmY